MLSDTRTLSCLSFRLIIMQPGGAFPLLVHLCVPHILQVPLFILRVPGTMSSWVRALAPLLQHETFKRGEGHGRAVAATNLPKNPKCNTGFTKTLLIAVLQRAERADCSSATSC